MKETSMTTADSAPVRVQETCDHAREGLRTLGASPWEFEVVEALERHGRTEGATLERYRRFADSADAPAVRFLVDLIMEEERRHHEALAQLAETIAWSLIPEAAEGDTIPALGFADTDPDLRRETRALLALERSDSVELRGLVKKMKSVRNTTLWALVLELIIADTSKHIKILEFLERTPVSPGARR
jgi:rubrerythrin